jgi:hypothetical protein
MPGWNRNGEPVPLLRGHGIKATGMMTGNLFDPMGTRMRVVALAVLFVTTATGAALADSIVLKSGRKVDVEMAWIENGQVKGILSGVEVMYPRSAVERIEQSRSETAADVEPQGGFQFGMWISGMRLDEVRRLAESHAIELSAGHLPSRDRYSAAPGASAPRAEDIAWHYAESLLERPAEVEMQFTPAGERLYGLTVRWMISETAAESDFFKTVYANLAQKYGRHDQKESKLLSMAYRWNIGKRSWVNLESGLDTVEIHYRDTEIEKTAAAEHPLRSSSSESGQPRPDP